MDERSWMAQRNIQQFLDLLARPLNEAQRRMILRLIEEEEERLAAPRPREEKLE